VSPEAATQAWLARLPAGERAAAAAHTDWRLAGFCLAGVLAIAVSLAVLRSDLLGRLRRAIEREGPRPLLASAALAAAFGLALFTALALLDGVCGWRGDHILGRAGALGGHLARALSGVPAGVAALIVIAPAAQWLMRRRPRTWPLIAGPVAMLGLLAVGWLPYALASDRGLPPLAPGPLRTALAGLVADAHIPARQIHVTTDPAMDVDVTGAFGHANVVVGPRMIHAPPAEAAAFAGHLMGHYVHGDIFSIWLLLGALVFAGFIAANLAFRPLASVLGCGRLKGPGDPEALPILALIAIVCLGAGGLALDGFIREINVGADAFSLAHARAPDGLAAVLERQWNHESVDPSPLEAALFYPHPPLEARLLHAMRWKAAHGG